MAVTVSIGETIGEKYLLPLLSEYGVKCPGEVDE